MDETAFNIFKLTNYGYCCTQIMIKMALDEEKKENADLLRAVQGLCIGIGGTQNACGALTGGLGILGLYAAKGMDKEHSKPEYSAMVKEYMEWFESQFGSIECFKLIGVCKIADNSANVSYMLKCGDILIKSYKKIQNILQEQGFEFGRRV